MQKIYIKGGYMSKTLYRIIILSIAVVLLTVGTYIGVKIAGTTYVDNKVLESVPDKVVNVTPVIGIYKSELQDIKVIYEDYYLCCKHTIINENMEFGITKEEIKEKVDKEYKLIEETDDILTFRKEIDSYCPNHFELRLESDYVIIYQIIKDDVYSIYKNTEIPRTSIRDELAEELVKGIRVDSLEELNMYIEDLES